MFTLDFLNMRIAKDGHPNHARKQDGIPQFER